MSYSAVQYRQPKALVQFVGRSHLTVPADKLVSVRTTKSMAQAAGTFEVVLKTVSAASPSGTSSYAPAVGAEGLIVSPLEDYWLDHIRPMTLCVIAFGSEADLQAVAGAVAPNPNADPTAPGVTVEGDFLVESESTTASSSNVGAADTQPNAVKQAVVMLGVVESVTLATAVTASGPERQLRVVGRDLARVLLEDTLRRWLRDKSDTMLVPIGHASAAGVTYDDVQKLLGRTQIGVTDNQWFQQTAAQGSFSSIPLSQFFPGVLAAAPTMLVQLDNGRKAVDYFRTGGEFNVDIDAPIKKFGAVIQTVSTLYAFNGAPWQALMAMAPRPMVECFVDTVGLSARLIVRRPPFGRRQSMQGFNELALHVGSMSLSGMENGDTTLNRMLDVSIAGLPEDDFANGTGSDAVKSRVVSDPYHIIHSKEVIQSSFTRSASEFVTMIQGTDITTTVGGLHEGLALFNPVIYDIPGAINYGTKFLPVMLPWGLLEGANQASRVQAGEPAGVTTDVLAAIPETNRPLNCIEAVRAYYFFRDNPEYLNAVLVIRGHPEIRIGDRLNLPDNGDLLFYVESVEQTYQFGQPYVTRLVLSRGQPRILNSRLATYDTDPPVGMAAVTIKAE